MLCPKCHRPTEGEEEYVCCAEADLQWRCRGCGKVNEGFAFPYGACPLCGDRLELMGDRSMDRTDALTAVREAFEIELGGRAFYARAAEDTKEPSMRELFSRLAAMEAEHMEILSRRYHADVPEPTPDFQVERAAIYAGIESRPEDPANLFRIAIACEERAVNFFNARKGNTAEGSVEQQLYQELAAEEAEHVALLSTEYELWRKGRAGLL